MSNYRLISADSHFVEPPSMWAERIDKRAKQAAAAVYFDHLRTSVNGK